MKLDEYGQELERVLRDSDHPLTAAELTREVGCSRQRVYTWLKGNQGRLNEVGKDRNGATRFAWVEVAQPKQVNAETVGMGSPLVVQRFFIEEGAIVLRLVGPDGSEYDARPAH